MTTKVSFQLMHPSQNLERIASVIGLPVARIWTAGQPRRTPTGGVLEGLNKESYCSFSISTNEGTIAAAIAAVDLALSIASAAQEELLGSEYRKKLYCTLIDAGESVDLQSLKLLVDWNISLDIEGPSI